MVFVILLCVYHLVHLYLWEHYMPMESSSQPRQFIVIRVYRYWARLSVGTLETDSPSGIIDYHFLLYASIRDDIQVALLKHVAQFALHYPLRTCANKCHLWNLCWGLQVLSKLCYFDAILEYDLMIVKILSHCFDTAACTFCFLLQLNYLLIEPFWSRRRETDDCPPRLGALQICYQIQCWGWLVCFHLSAFLAQVCHRLERTYSVEMYLIIWLLGLLVVDHHLWARLLHLIMHIHYLQLFILGLFDRIALGFLLVSLLLFVLRYVFFQSFSVFNLVEPFSNVDGWDLISGVHWCRYLYLKNEVHIQIVYRNLMHLNTADYLCHGWGR